MDQSSPAPNYYAIIPAHIRYCAELEPNAKLLYGELTALCNKEGYCWATNQYFADLYQVDISTVQRWLVSLKDKNFINVEIKKNGFQTQRKIWIVNGFQINSTKPQKQGPDTSELRSRHLKNETHNNTQNNTYEKNNPLPPKGDERVSFGKFVKIEKEAYEKFCQEYTKEVIDDLIDQMNDHLASTGKKPYRDYAAALRTWLRRRKEMHGTSIVSSDYQTNKAQAERWYKDKSHLLPSTCSVEITDKFVRVIIARANYDEKYYYKDPITVFKQQMDKVCKKIADEFDALTKAV